MIGPEVLDLEDEARVVALAREWRELAAQFDGSSYFQTPDWVVAWWETIARRPHTQVATWHGPSGRLEAVVPLSRDRERLHRRLPLTVPVYANAGSGAGDADHCGWLVPAQRGEDVTAWLSEATAGSALLVRNADSDWPAGVLPSGARMVESTACPTLTLPPRPATGEPSKGFVRQLRRFTRRLAREGVRFEWVPPTRVDEPLLVRLFELHAQRREGRAGGQFSSHQLPFHRELVKRAGPGRGPAAAVARRGGSIVGVVYGFWWRDTFAAYQSGWDRAYARHGLGNVLVLHALEFVAGEGGRRFDFLRGAEPYKYRFGARDRWDRTWLVPRGPAGALLAARHRVRRLKRGIAVKQGVGANAQRERSTRRRGRLAAVPPGRG